MAAETRPTLSSRTPHPPGNLQTSAILHPETWNVLLQTLLSMCDVMFSRPVESDDFSDYFSKRLLGVLFDLWASGLSMLLPSAVYWKTWSLMSSKWRHRCRSLRNGWGCRWCCSSGPTTLLRGKTVLNAITCRTNEQMKLFEDWKPTAAAMPFLPDDLLVQTQMRMILLLMGNLGEVAVSDKATSSADKKLRTVRVIFQLNIFFTVCAQEQSLGITIDPSFDWLIDWLIPRLIDWLIVVDWLIDWLIMGGWLIDWLWVVYWLIGWLNSTMHRFFQLSLSHDTFKESDSSSATLAPLIFLKLMTGVTIMVDLAMNKLSCIDCYLDIAWPDLTQLSSAPSSTASLTDITGSAVQTTGSSAEIPSVPTKGRPLRCELRIPCRGLLHLFGPWLFQASLMGEKRRSAQSHRLLMNENSKMSFEQNFFVFYKKK